MKPYQYIAAVCAIVSALCTPVPVCARGGVYIDDLILKNNGSVVFSENFDSGDLAGWYSARDALVSSNHFNSAGYSLYENMHSGVSSSLRTDVSVSNPGLLELSFNVWLPDVSEQWNSSGSTTTSFNIVLNSTTANQYYSAGLLLYPHESLYKTCLNGVRQISQPCSSGAWQNIVVRLDPTEITCPPAGLGQISLNNGEPLSSTYYPLSTIDRIMITTTFGDNQPVPEPSCIIALLIGLAASGLRSHKK